MNRPTLPHSGRRISRAQHMEATDASPSEANISGISPFLARYPRMVRRRSLCALSAFLCVSIWLSSRVDRQRILRRAIEPPILSPQSLLLTSLTLAALVLLHRNRASLAHYANISADCVRNSFHVVSFQFAAITILKPSFIIHGGAWNIPDEAVPDCRAGIRRALEAGWKVLSGSGTALDAVEAAIIVLEDDPTFDAGFGSHLNRDGHVQLDAIVMDGKTLKAGAVAAVEHIRNPIRLARLVLEKSEHMMLVAAGAEKFATEHGLALSAPEELIHPRERFAWQRCLEDY